MIDTRRGHVSKWMPAIDSAPSEEVTRMIITVLRGRPVTRPAAVFR